MRLKFPIRLVHIWDRLLSTLWFVPTVMSMGALVLAAVLPILDVRLDIGDALVWELFAGSSVEGARAMLSTIAGSMITVAGVVFSITIVALTLASSQFGPRLLRNFMRDTANQVVLGAYISTFLYCMLVLKTVRENGDHDFVPHFSLLAALIMAGWCIGLLIYFIHHIATSIQAEQVVARVMVELRATLGRMCPEAQEDVVADTEEADGFPENLPDFSLGLRATKDGYIQRIDYDELMPKLTEEDLYLEVKVRPGDFCLKEEVIAFVGPKEKLDEGNGKKLAGEFIQGPVRTPVQDITFPFGQIVEVAVRSLSPGINDPMTAMLCVDQLTAALGECTSRCFPSTYRKDREGRTRIRTSPLDFAELVRLSYRQIFHYGRENPEVVAYLLHALSSLVPRLRSWEQVEALRGEVQRMGQLLESASAIETDMDTLRKLVAELMEALESWRKAE